MAKDEEPQPTPDDGPDVTPPELTSETWIKAQETVLLYGTALRAIAKATDDPDIWKTAINAIIRSGMQSLFLSEEL